MWIMWGRGVILAIIWSSMSMLSFSYGCLAWERDLGWMKAMPWATVPWTFLCLRFSNSDKNIFWLGVVKRNLTLPVPRTEQRDDLLWEARWGELPIKIGTKPERYKENAFRSYCVNFFKNVKLKAETLLIPPVPVSSLSHCQELLTQAGTLCPIAVGESGMCNLM